MPKMTTDDCNAADHSRAVDNEPMVRYFGYDHLPPHLHHMSHHFCDLAHFICGALPRSAERTICLRKLLEARWHATSAMIIAKDAAVRARRAGGKPLP